MRRLVPFFAVALLAGPVSCGGSEQNPSNSGNIGRDGGSPDASAGASDGGTSASGDAGITPSPGHISLDWSCYPAIGNQSNGMVTLTPMQFGNGFMCDFTNQELNLSYQRDKYLIKLLVDQNYNGPGTYPMPSAGIYDLAWGLTYYKWPDNMTIVIPDSTCVGFTGAPPNKIDCSITVNTHTATQVTGTFGCSVTIDHLVQQRDGSLAPDGKIDRDVVNGDFAYGPNDCKSM